jgi:uncharacterized membrane protein
MSRDQNIKIERRPPDEEPEEETESSGINLRAVASEYRWYFAVVVGLLAVVGILFLIGFGVSELLVASAVLLISAVGLGVAWILHKVFLATGAQY